MFSYVFHGLLGFQGMLVLYLLRISQVPDIPMVFPANRGTSKARLTAKAEGWSENFATWRAHESFRGGGRKDVKIVLLIFFNGGIEGRGIDVNIRFLGIKGFWGEDFCWDWFPQMHFKIKLWICFVGRGSGVGFAWCWFDLFSIISSYNLKTHDERTSLFGGRGMFSNWFPEMHLYESLFFWTGDNFNSVGQNSKWQPKSQVFRTKKPWVH